MKLSRFGIFVVAVLTFAGFLYTQFWESAPHSCGSSSQLAAFNESSGNLEVHDGAKFTAFTPEVRTISANFDTGHLWFGTTNGEVYRLAFEEMVVETCSLTLPEATPVNDILSWNGAVYIATDGNGVWRFDGQWMNLPPAGSYLEAYNDVYDLSIDPRNLHLLVATRAGIFSYDNSAWEVFKLMPPDHVLAFHSIAYAVVDAELGRFEWMLGSISHGTYRFINGTWERYSSRGLEQWNTEVGHGWELSPHNTGAIFPDNVREVSAALQVARIRYTQEVPFEVMTTSETEYFGNLFMIAGDGETGVQLTAVVTGLPTIADSYRFFIPQTDGPQLRHLTSVKAFDEQSFVATNYHSGDGEGGGAYFSNFRGELVSLTSYPSYDAEVLSNYTYIATAHGIVRVRLPFEPSMVCLVDCEAAAEVTPDVAD